MIYGKIIITEVGNCVIRKYIRHRFYVTGKSALGQDNMCVLAVPEKLTTLILFTTRTRADQHN